MLLKLYQKTNHRQWGWEWLVTWIILMLQRCQSEVLLVEETHFRSNLNHWIVTCPFFLKKNRWYVKFSTRFSLSGTYLWHCWPQLKSFRLECFAVGVGRNLQQYIKSRPVPGTMQVQASRWLWLIEHHPPDRSAHPSTSGDPTATQKISKKEEKKQRSSKLEPWLSSSKNSIYTTILAIII